MVEVDTGSKIKVLRTDNEGEYISKEFTNFVATIGAAKQLEELYIINNSGTWSLVDRPPNRNIIGVEWIYRKKQNPDGSLNRYKTKLAMKGYNQQLGVDYRETFAPISRLDTILLLLALSVDLGWNIYHLDLKFAFFNEILEEEINVYQLEGFEVRDEPNKVYKLHKALYGLKQAPQSWYSRIDAYLIS
ncbi:Reverse transcriptase [Theobroma cacao]|nr:Reverse transcriptase [Theobroma cacao]